MSSRVIRWGLIHKSDKLDRVPVEWTYTIKQVFFDIFRVCVIGTVLNEGPKLELEEFSLQVSVEFEENAYVRPRDGISYGELRKSGNYERVIIGQNFEILKKRKQKLEGKLNWSEFHRQIPGKKRSETFAVEIDWPLELEPQFQTKTLFNTPF